LFWAPPEKKGGPGVLFWAPPEKPGRAGVLFWAPPEKPGRAGVLLLASPRARAGPGARESPDPVGGPGDVPRCGALSLLQKPLHFRGIQKSSCWCYTENSVM
jgi:hypothetical protein